MKVTKTLIAIAAAATVMAGIAPAPATAAEEVKWVRSIPFNLALEGALAAMACGDAAGSHVSVGVMDFSGQMKVLLVPDNATLVGENVLPRKMYAALLLQQATSPIVLKTSRPERSETGITGNVLDRISPGSVISPGGVPLFAGKDFVGVLGVGGATTPGDVDTKCAQAGADKIKDRLN